MVIFGCRGNSGVKNSHAVPFVWGFKIYNEVDLVRVGILTAIQTNNRWAIVYYSPLYFIRIGKMKDLKTLLTEYEKNLCDRLFVLTLSNNKTINIRFFREDMCHLMGIQHVYDKSKKYLGAEGYKKINNGDITFKILKKVNKSGYDMIKERLQHFDEIYDLVSQGEIIQYEITKVYPYTRIEADFCIHKDETTYILHLFLKKAFSSSLYSPTSFVVKTCNDENYKQFIKNQKYQKIISREIIKDREIKTVQ